MKRRVFPGRSLRGAESSRQYCRLAASRALAAFAVLSLVAFLAPANPIPEGSTAQGDRALEEIVETLAQKSVALLSQEEQAALLYKAGKFLGANSAMADAIENSRVQMEYEVIGSYKDPRLPASFQIGLGDKTASGKLKLSNLASFQVKAKPEDKSIGANFTLGLEVRNGVILRRVISVEFKYKDNYDYLSALGLDIGNIPGARTTLLIMDGIAGKARQQNEPSHTTVTEAAMDELKQMIPALFTSSLRFESITIGRGYSISLESDTAGSIKGAAEGSIRYLNKERFASVSAGQPIRFYEVLVGGEMGVKLKKGPFEAGAGLNGSLSYSSDPEKKPDPDRFLVAKVLREGGIHQLVGRALDKFAPVLKTDTILKVLDQVRSLGKGAPGKDPSTDDKPLRSLFRTGTPEQCARMVDALQVHLSNAVTPEDQRKTLQAISVATRATKLSNAGINVVEWADKRNLQLTSSASETLRPGTGQEKLGGVKLEVVFDLLASLDQPIIRNSNETRKLANPVLASLRSLLAAAQAESADPAHWPSNEQVQSLGGLTRIHGYLLDSDHEDIILIGDSEPGVTPIGLDNLVAALQSVWLNGQTPAVSLDPRPDHPAGPQYPRILGVGANSRFAKTMLDADYAMKRVMLGEDRVRGLPGYKSLEDLYRQRPEAHLGGNRFWLFPVRFGAHDIRTSRSGDLTLFDAKLQVLTEAMALTQDTVTATGEPDPLAEEGARLFTDNYSSLAEQVRWEGKAVLKELRGLLDLVTVCSLLRVARDSELLAKLAALPVPKVSIPASYTGLRREVGAGGNKVIVIEGGVLMRRSLGKRLLDGYEDVQTRQLRAAAETLVRGGRISIRADGLTVLLVEPPVSKKDKAEQAFDAGLRNLAAGELQQARFAFSQAVEADPDLFEGYVLRSFANFRLGNTEAAEEDIDKALTLEPQNNWLQSTKLWLSIERKRQPDLQQLDHRAIIGVRNLYALRGERKLAAGKFNEAIEDLSKALSVAESEESQLYLVFRRAYAREMAGDFFNSEADYKQASRLYRLTAPLAAVGLDRIYLGLCRLELDLGRCKLTKSEDSSCQLARFSADAPVQLEAVITLSAARVSCLKKERDELIIAGRQISKSRSLYEVSTLQDCIADLQKQIGELTPEARRSSEYWLRKAEELAGAIERRIKMIKDNELNDR